MLKSVQLNWTVILHDFYYLVKFIQLPSLFVSKILLIFFSSFCLFHIASGFEVTHSGLCDVRDLIKRRHHLALDRIGLCEKSAWDASVLTVFATSLNQKNFLWLKMYILEILNLLIWVPCLFFWKKRIYLFAQSNEMALYLRFHFGVRLSLSVIAPASLPFQSKQQW